LPRGADPADVPAQLVVHLNRGERGEVQATTDRFEVTGPFEVRVHNHGAAARVHLKLLGPLAEVAAVGENNHLVDTDGTVLVPVRVADGAAGVEGGVEVVGAYGEGRQRVPVAVREPAPDPEPDDDPGTVEEEPSSDGVLDRFAARVGGADLALGRRGRLAAVAALGLALVAVTTVLVDGDPLLVFLAAVLLGAALAVARRS
jgi:hypothetical protein